MINVLSIDWDYYINTTDEIREKCFPKILEDVISEEQRNDMWKAYYENYNIKNIGILEKDFDESKKLIHDIEEHSRHVHVFINDSHRFIYDAIKEEMKNHIGEEVKVYNIDHHHDMFQYRTSSEKVNCSNWAQILKEEIQEKLNYNWIKREDSEEYSLAGKVECKCCKLKDICERDFDIIYLCRSGAWSPPHLDYKYEEFKKFILNEQKRFKLSS